MATTIRREGFGSSPNNSNEIFTHKSCDQCPAEDRAAEEEIIMGSELPQEVLFDIFSRLDLEKRWKSAAFVSKAWLRAFQDPFFWQVVDFEKCFARTRETDYWWTEAFEKRMNKMVQIAVNYGGERLIELHTRHCSDESIAYLAQRCPNIQRLSIKACQNVTDMSVCQIAYSCPKIEELDISYCHNISCASLEKLGANCKYLTTIKRNMFNSLDPSEHILVPTEYISSAPLSGDEEAAAFSKFISNLKHLEIRFSNLSQNGLRLLVDGCPNLEHLDLFGCSNLRRRTLDDAIENAKNLKKLIKPNFFIPITSFHVERYGHWQLYDDRFQTNTFQI